MKRSLHVIGEHCISAHFLLNALGEYARSYLGIVGLISHQHYSVGDGKLVELLGGAIIVRLGNGALGDLDRLNII